MTIDLLTMSKSDVLLNCGFPFGAGVIVPKDRSDTIESKFGTAYHLIAASLLERKPLPEAAKLAKYVHAKDVPLLVKRAQYVHKGLVKWLGKNEFGYNFNASKRRLVEKAVGFDPKTGAVRLMRASDDDHVYKDRVPGEIPGTSDLAILERGTLLVLDHKTGIPPETKSDQNMTLAAALRMLWLKYGVKRIVVAIHHVPREGGPATVYAEEVTVAEVQAHARALYERLARVDDGWLRPGPWCKYCPAKAICPAENAELLNTARDLLPALVTKAAALSLASNGNAGLTRQERFGHVHQLIEVYDELRGKVDERLRIELAEIKTGVRPDGQLVEFIPKMVERLSKGTLERQLGKLAAARELNRLRKLGGLEKKEQLEMRKVADR